MRDDSRTIERKRIDVSLGKPLADVLKDALRPAQRAEIVMNERDSHGWIIEEGPACVTGGHGYLSARLGPCNEPHFTDIDR
jgi:hypothetical protein